MQRHVDVVSHVLPCHPARQHPLRPGVLVQDLRSPFPKTYQPKESQAGTSDNLRPKLIGQSMRELKLMSSSLGRKQIWNCVPKPSGEFGTYITQKSGLLILVPTFFLLKALQQLPWLFGVEPGTELPS